MEDEAKANVNEVLLQIDELETALSRQIKSIRAQLYQLSRPHKPKPKLIEFVSPYGKSTPITIGKHSPGSK